MFLHVSVILFTGRGVCLWGGSASRGVCIQRVLHPGGEVARKAGDTHPTRMLYCFL